MPQKKTKVCFKCKFELPKTEFYPCKGRYDGLQTYCKKCTITYILSRYTYKSRIKAKPRTIIRDNDELQAHNRIRTLIRAGVIPKANDLPCIDCGHTNPTSDNPKELKGYRRHEYDHYKGYGKDHHEDVEVRCSKCHHKVTCERSKDVVETPF